MMAQSIWLRMQAFIQLERSESTYVSHSIRIQIVSKHKTISTETIIPSVSMIAVKNKNELYQFFCLL